MLSPVRIAEMRFNLVQSLLIQGVPAANAVKQVATVMSFIEGGTAEAPSVPPAPEG